MCGSRANHPRPSRCTGSLCCLVGSGSGGVREALYNLLLPHPSKWVFWWETPFVQDGHARIRRKKLKSMSYKDICCWYIPKTSQVTAWPSFCAPHASCFLCISRQQSPFCRSHAMCFLSFCLQPGPAVSLTPNSPSWTSQLLNPFAGICNRLKMWEFDVSNVAERNATFMVFFSPWMFINEWSAIFSKRTIICQLTQHPKEAGTSQSSANTQQTNQNGASFNCSLTLLAIAL